MVSDYHWIVASNAQIAAMEKAKHGTCGNLILKVSLGALQGLRIMPCVTVPHTHTHTHVHAHAHTHMSM